MYRSLHFILSLAACVCVYVVFQVVYASLFTSLFYCVSILKFHNAFALTHISQKKSLFVAHSFSRSQLQQLKKKNLCLTHAQNFLSSFDKLFSQTQITTSTISIGVEIYGNSVLWINLLFTWILNSIKMRTKHIDFVPSKAQFTRIFVCNKTPFYCNSKFNISLTYPVSVRIIYTHSVCALDCCCHCCWFGKYFVYIFATHTQLDTIDLFSCSSL